MVHNGIEYGDMQLICEAYHLMKSYLNMTNEEIASTFEEWNKGDLDSYLIEVFCSSQKLAYRTRSLVIFSARRMRRPVNMFWTRLSTGPDKREPESGPSSMDWTWDPL